MMLRFLSVILFCLSVQLGFAQKPVIEKIEPLNSYPLDQLLITGSGFSSTPAQLQVWFGQVKGTITNSTDFTIQVTVPPQAKLDNIEVINLNSKLSAKSSAKYMPTYSGTDFTPANLTNPVLFNSTHTVFDICTCDLNNNGKPDIITTKDNDLATDLMVLRNETTPRSITGASFVAMDKATIPAFDINSRTSHVICGDLDNDGKPDLIAARGGAEPNRIFLFRNTSGASISFDAVAPLLMEGTDRAWRVALGDFNNDGRSDLVVTNAQTTSTANVYVFPNQSTTGTISFGAPLKFTLGVESYGVDIQDFDGDGKLDIVTNRFNAAGIYFLRNTSAGTITFASPYALPAAGAFNSITSADFNNDGKQDVAVSNFFNNQVMVYFNQSTVGTISFRTTPLILTATNRPVGVEVADINGDGFPDIVAANLNQATVNVYLHNKNYTTPGFTKIDIPTTKANRTVKVGDLDGDAKPDLALSSSVVSAPFTVEILRNTNCHKPIILTPTPIVICRADQTVRLQTINAPSVTSYQWLKDGNLVNTTAVPYYDITGFSAAGSYTVRAISESGTCAGSVSLSDPVVVSTGNAIIPDNPVINSNATNDQVCAGASLTLSTNTVTGASYIWKGPNNFSATTNTPTAPAIPNMQQVNSGLYTLQVKIGDCSSNIVSKLIEVVDFQSFTISSSVASNSICQGGSLTLSVASGYSYQWFRNDVATGSNSNQLVVTQAGNYKVSVSNAANCPSTTAPVTVKVLALPVAAFNASSTACTFQVIPFTNQSTTDANGTPTYLWEFGTGQPTKTDKDPTHSYNTANTYQVKLTVGYSGVTGCTNAITKDIVVTASEQPLITTVPNVTTMCPGEQVALTVNGTFTSVTWSPGGSTSTTINITQPGTYTVNTVAANGCTGQSQKTIATKQVPALEVTASPTQLQRGQSSQLLATGADTYEWTPTETLNNALIADPIATPTSTTEYTVVGTLAGQCAATAKIKITVGGGTLINAPLMFSPNGDLTNDYWIIPDVENYQDCTMSVFDGRGRRVYEKVGYPATGWDGKYNGNDVPAGTYYYVFGCPNEKPVTGSVLIVR